MESADEMKPNEDEILTTAQNIEQKAADIMQKAADISDDKLRSAFIAAAVALLDQRNTSYSAMFSSRNEVANNLADLLLKQIEIAKLEGNYPPNTNGYDKIITVDHLNATTAVIKNPTDIAKFAELMTDVNEAKEVASQSSLKEQPEIKGWKAHDYASLGFNISGALLIAATVCVIFFPPAALPLLAAAVVVAAISTLPLIAKAIHTVLSPVASGLKAGYEGAKAVAASAASFNMSGGSKTAGALASANSKLDKALNVLGADKPKDNPDSSLEDSHNSQNNNTPHS